MPTQLTVTPGLVVAADTVLDPDALNLLGQPLVAIPGAGLQPADIDQDALAAAMADRFRQVNHLPNGNFWPESFGAPGGVACPAGSYTDNAEGWGCKPSGASGLVYSRAYDSPDTKNVWCAKLTGATGVTSVRFGAYVRPAVTSQFAGEEVTFSIWIKNVGSGAYTPALYIDCSTSLGDPATAAYQYDDFSADSATWNAWTRHEWTFDTSAITDWENGAYITVEVPSGELSSVSEQQFFAQAQLEPGDGATAFMRPVYYRTADQWASVPDATAGGYDSAIVTKGGVPYRVDFSGVSAGDFAALCYNGGTLDIVPVATKAQWRDPASVSDSDSLDSTTSNASATATQDSGTWTVPAWFPADATRAVFRGHWRFFGDSDPGHSAEFALCLGGTSIGHEYGRMEISGITRHREANLTDVEVPLVDTGGGVMGFDWSITRTAETGTTTELSTRVLLRCVGYRTD